MSDTPTNNTPLCIRYLPAEQAGEIAGDPQTLAVIGFGVQSGFDGRRLTIGLPQLAGDDVLEVWQTSAPVLGGVRDDVEFWYTPDLLVGRILLPLGAHTDMAQQTRDVYRQILALQQDTGFEHMVRIWHYFPGITQLEDGMQRYQSFCVGRHDAIDTSQGFESHLPAATAIGTHDDRLLVFFIAAREDGVQVENPRQVSAFRYPEVYAPKSPTFSRAVLKDWGARRDLYISGTASILGHETRHRGDVSAQLEECLNNIDVLVGEARARHGLGIETAADLTAVKVYLRNAADCDPVMDILQRRLGDRPLRLVLAADICRDDLLLEVEGLYSGC